MVKRKICIQCDEWFKSYVKSNKAKCESCKEKNMDIRLKKYYANLNHN
jgi:hypothetical protein